MITMTCLMGVAVRGSCDAVRFWTGPTGPVATSTSAAVAIDFLLHARIFLPPCVSTGGRTVAIGCIVAAALAQRRSQHLLTHPQRPLAYRLLVISSGSFRGGTRMKPRTLMVGVTLGVCVAIAASA